MITLEEFGHRNQRFNLAALCDNLPYHFVRLALPKEYWSSSAISKSLGNFGGSVTHIGRKITGGALSSFPSARVSH
jgi:hypothetical protein